MGKSRRKFDYDDYEYDNYQYLKKKDQEKRKAKKMKNALRAKNFEVNQYNEEE